MEILVLASLALAIVAITTTRRNTVRLSDEIADLKREVETLKRHAPSGMVESGAARENAPEPSAESEAEVAEDFTSPWSEAGKGRDIFGGAQAQAVDTGEPADAVAARHEASGDVSGAEAPAAAPAQRESFESRIGARWAVWVGGIALALGGIFMVRYSIESGLLSPAVRLALAALFGLVLIAAGEFVRRRAQPLVANEFRNAMIPGVLTAAGAVTLFAVTYVAYGFYAYVGPLTAFALLAAVSFATIGLSLLHGQALAGLGLLASMATPLLVATGEPRPWVLFSYLTVSWLATLLASRLRRWQAVPSVANIALGLWAVLYLSGALPVEPLPVVLSIVAMLAGVGLIWPGGLEADAADAGEMPVNDTPVPSGGMSVNAWERLLAPPVMAVSFTAALAALFPALVFASMVPGLSGAAAAFAALVTALALLGALRCWGIYPAAVAGFGAFAGTVLLTAMPGGFSIDALTGNANGTFDGTAPVPTAGSAPVGLILALAAGLALAGAVALFLRLKRAPEYCAVWSGLMTAPPFAMTAISFFVFGNLSFDARHGLFAAAFGLALLAGAEIVSRAARESEREPAAQWTFVAGGFAFLVLALHALTDGLATTLLVAALGFAAVAATRLRRWPVLPWTMVGAALVVAGRIAWEPTISGPESLSTTPVFNQLLAGYGIPALLLALSAFELRRWPDVRVRNLLQALASLFVLLTAAILVRHAMNGGVLDSAVPTLGEQSIYTLLAIGASAVMMTLDLKSPSPVFRYGSMALGVLTVFSILSAHFLGLNPYFTGELTGRVPFFDLLLIGYLLPGLAFAGLAWYARNRRPVPYVTMLALTGAALAFAWVTLTVRRAWHGQSIADWKGFLQGETYTYSVVWLLLGVGLLALGSKFDARSIRLASAGLVLLAVIKVFLIDMSNLEGILRALSFIGLGVVLIGIGLFYQKILSGKGGGGPQQAAG